MVLKLQENIFLSDWRFAGTAHKGQGQTLNKVMMYLRSSFFSPVQLYVALSCAKNSTDFLLHKQDHKPANIAPTHNIAEAVSNAVLREADTFSEGC